MKTRLTGIAALEAVAIVLFLVFIFPFFIVIVNSAKTPFEITQSPLSPPAQWLKIFRTLR